LIEEVKKAIGENWFRAFVVGFACLWLWHSFFGSIAEVGTAEQSIATGHYAEQRQRDEATSAAARAAIETETAKFAKARQEAEATSAAARAAIETETAKFAKLRQEAEATSAAARAAIETETAKFAKSRQEAEATSAAARAAIDTETAKNVAREAKARADEKEAQACTARIDYAMKSMSLTEIAAHEQEIFGCDPSYMTQRQSPPAGEACVARMEAIIRDVAPKNPDFIEGAEVKQWKSDCSGKMSKQQRDKAMALVTAYAALGSPECLKRGEQLYAAAPRDIEQMASWTQSPEMKKFQADCDGKMSEAQVAQFRQMAMNAANAALKAFATKPK
jgi:hypothetical protein